MALNESIDSFLNRAQVALDNAANTPKIQEYLLEYGYTPAKIQAGRKLYETAWALQQQQRKEYGEQIEATDTLRQIRETVNNNYMRCLKIARIAFQNNPGVATELDLNGDRKRSFSGWLSQIQQFYTNALTNSTILQGLGEYGITEAILKQYQQEVNAVEAANLQQEKEKGDAQNATQQRDKAIDELNQWLSDFIAIARIALEAEPQLLESLGILARS